ncbi:MAG: uncharacterized protein A8A55_2809 [Amphiamblys sp. WSBS2006]|nr:MAG: uncharacterized protein A8A55_2809 [Amphiamblys sp. WSBS2006]
MRRDGVDLREREKDAICVCCRGDQETDGVFLLPTCEMAHGFVCEECVRELGPDDRIRCSFGCCGDGILLEDLYESVFEKTENMYSTDGMAEKAHVVGSWTPTAPGLYTRRILLLTSETRVTLENVVISDLLLFKLLEKTNVSVKENISIFGNERKNDCIIEKLEEYGTDVDLSDGAKRWEIKNEAHLLENIRKIPGNSIACDVGSVFIRKGIHFCILPKLKETSILSPGCEIESMRELGSNCSFNLTISKKRYMLKLRSMESKSISIGKVKEMTLTCYGVLILPKMKIPADNSMELALYGREIEYISGIFQEPDNSIWVGRLERLDIDIYIGNILPKLSTGK